MRRTLQHLGVLAALSPWALADASAHEGPPFPIVIDRAAGPYVISVWTDPDVGIGKFFVFVEPAAETTFSEGHEVKVCVQPADGRLDEACYSGVRQAKRGREQYYAEVEFDRQEIWKVRVQVSGSEGTAEVSTEVEATPPGLGQWDMLFYGFPFILFGALWAYAALRRKRNPGPAPNAGAVG
jgi:hypothetical protein